MGFHEVRFPDDISYGSAGGPGFSTHVIETDSGAEQRVARWAAPRHRYNVAYGLKSEDQLSAVRTFYIARQGCANGFRFKDFLDFTTATNGTDTPTSLDCDLDIGDGTETQFQLRKKYTSGGYTIPRLLTKPVEDSVLVSIDDVEQSSGWTVNTTTGIVTFTVAPAVGEVVKAGCEFDVPVRFGTEVDSVLMTSHTSFDTGDVSDIPLIEIKAEGEIDDEFFFGGAKDHGTISANVTISHAQGRVHSFTPSGAGIKVRLPDETDLPLGGPHFFLFNTGAVSVEIQTYTGDTVATIAADGSAVIVLGLDGSTKTWYAA